MKKNTKKILLIAAIVAVGYLVFRQFVKRNEVPQDNVPWFPAGMGTEAVSAFKKKYDVFVVGGRTYYAHKEGQYSEYALSPHNNERLYMRDGTVRYSGNAHNINYAISPVWRRKRIAPEYVTWKSKRYKVLTENLKPDTPESDGGHKFIENHPEVPLSVGYVGYYALFPELALV